MDNFNFKNLQLAYGAVYDQNLCESMEELGLIGDGNSEQDQFELWVNELLDEGYDLSDYTWDELYEGYKKLPVGKMIQQAAHKAGQKGSDAQIAKMARVASRHSTIKGKAKIRGEGQAELNRRRGEMKEDYDAFDVVLEYLLDEGFAETIEGAEAIMVNMSEGWIETILVEKEGYGDAAIDKDPLSKYRPDSEAREYLKKNPYNVNRRFFPKSGELSRGSRTSSDVMDTLKKMEGKSKPTRKLPDPDRSNRAPAPRKLPNPKR
jgi:hypothetical protein